MINFSDLEKQLITASLSGWEGQKQMSPPYRALLTPEEIEAKNPKQSAVSIVLYIRENRFYFPVIVRNVYHGVHSGQVSLPGGKREKIDASFEETARRETQEELGLKTENLKIIRDLTPIYIPPSNFQVYPYISVYQSDEIIFSPDEKEVSRVVDVDLENFLTQTPIVWSSAPTRKTAVPCFVCGGLLIWGATAMILNEFRLLFKK
ncbi:MAG: CoA pyrophosphatase [Flavobacteriaceae bacterium]|jgi:8-oxo-dGTP pyrophosphatase MutT (NUDIX family)|nr:CoA pyrophosphatase [Flavobacteriaceae bacterium]